MTTPTPYTHPGPGDLWGSPEEDDDRQEREQAAREERQEQEIDRLHYGWSDN